MHNLTLKEQSEKSNKLQDMIEAIEGLEYNAFTLGPKIEVLRSFVMLQIQKLQVWKTAVIQI